MQDSNITKIESLGFSVAFCDGNPSAIYTGVSSYDPIPSALRGLQVDGLAGSAVDMDGEWVSDYLGPVHSIPDETPLYLPTL